MSRNRTNVDLDVMADMLSCGLSIADVAKEFDTSTGTIQNRIKELRSEESALLAYDKVHYLDLISVKRRLVAGVTDEKIAEAPLSQIAAAYGIFGKMEQLIQGRPTEIHGLMGYLMHIEKMENEKKMQENGETIDGECEEQTEGSGTGTAE